MILHSALEAFDKLTVLELVRFGFLYYLNAQADSSHITLHYTHRKECDALKMIK